MQPQLLTEPPQVGSFAFDQNGVPPRVPNVQRRRFSPSAEQVPSVVAELGYIKPTNERLFNYMYEPPEGAPWQNFEPKLRPIRISDARSFSSRLSIHREGFELWDAPSAVTNFHDEEAVLNVYYQEAADLARAVTGAQHAYVFDHQLRKREVGRPPLTFGRYGDGSNPAAVGRVHNDYSEESGRKRLGLVLKDPVAAAAVERYSIVNIWRSIAGPILDTPLAVCDARTVSVTDLHACEIRYQTRSGEIYLSQYSPRHHWSYFSAMDRHEALVFKQYDSQAGGVARFTLHAAFDLANIPPETPLRESIEVRCLVIYD